MEEKGFGAVVIQQDENCQALLRMIYPPQSQLWRQLLCPSASLLRFRAPCRKKGADV